MFALTGATLGPTSPEPGAFRLLATQQQSPLSLDGVYLCNYPTETFDLDGFTPSPGTSEDAAPFSYSQADRGHLGQTMAISGHFPSKMNTRTESFKTHRYRCLPGVEW
jgi:hypothetical protein